MLSVTVRLNYSTPLYRHRILESFLTTFERCKAQISIDSKQENVGTISLSLPFSSKYLSKPEVRRMRGAIMRIEARESGHDDYRASVGGPFYVVTGAL